MKKVADYIEEHRDGLVERFFLEASHAPSAAGLKRNEIIDTLYEYLSTLAEISRQGHRGDPAKTKQRLEETHLSLRLRLGFTQEEVTAEYALIGRLISELWDARPADEQPTPQDVALLFEELDAAMLYAVAIFTGYSVEERQAEKRTLRRLDALAPKAIGIHAPPEELHRHLSPLLAVIEEALGAKGAGLFLVDGETQELVLAASTGLCAQAPKRFSVRAHDPSSFVGWVASSEEPVQLPDVRVTELAVSAWLQQSGLRSLLGLRLWPQGELLGVLYVGVTEVRPFEPRTRRYFEVLVEHLSGIIQRAGFAWEAQRRAEFEKQLVGIVSHDLRSPLSAIFLSASALLKREELDERTVKSASRIFSAADRALRLIRDLLDYSHARVGGGIPVQPATCDLHDIARSVVEEIRLSHPHRDIHFAAEGEGQGAFDCDRLSQVLTNLIVNAVQHSPRDTPVHVQAQSGEAEQKIFVRNLGAPIAPEALPQLFEPFKRGHAPGAGTGSVGLGLFIARNIVEAHGGRLELSSNEAEGTTFTVHLPRTRPKA